MRDRRAVAGVVGAVLLFGILVISLSIYQAQVVPAENKQLEFQHNERIHDQLTDVRNAVLRTAGSGNSQPVSVSLGLRYPTRVAAVNPPPVSGSLRSEPFASNVTIRNVEATDAETADYVSGTLSYSTSRLVYHGDYHEYRNAPRTVYENGVLYNRFDNGANLTLTGQSMLSGNRLTLVTLAGDYDESGIRSASVDPHPSSAPYHGVTVTNESDGPLVLSLPTTLSASKWGDLLAGQISNGRVRDVTPGDNGTVDVRLEPGTYVLQLSRVGVGSGVEDPGAHYLVRDGGDGASLNPGESQGLDVAVRDRFNNPYAGETVRAAVTSGPGSVTTDATTGSDGDASFTYTAPGTVSGSDSVEVAVWFGAPNASATGSLERTTFDLTVTSGGGSGSGGGGQGGTGTGDSTGPTIQWRLDDLSNGQQNRVEYVASYELEDTNSSFDHVEIRFNDNDGSSQATETNAKTRGGVEYTSDNGAGHSWDVSLSVVYERSDGSTEVVASRQFTDVPDAVNPSSNADLGGTGSPSISQFDVTDRSNNGQGPRYDLSYGVSNTGQFDRARGALLALDRGGYDIQSSSSTLGKFTLSTYGYQNDFVVKLLVYDDDGVVVGYRESSRDTADGSGP